jgi:hypothetical protein
MHTETTLLQVLRECGEVKLRLVEGGLKPTLEMWGGGVVRRVTAEDLKFSTGGSLTLVHGQGRTTLS